MNRSLKQLVIYAGPLAALILGSCSPSDKGARHLENGNAYFEKKDYQRALLEYRNALQFRPSDPEPRYRMALAMVETGEARSAVALLRRTLEMDPAHRGAQLKLAELMAYSPGTKWVTEAGARAQQALLNEPENPDWLQVKAITEWRLGQVEDATRHLEAALAKFPAHLKTGVTLAWMKLNKKEVAGAEQVLRSLLRQAPESPATLQAMGRFLSLMGRWNEAQEQFELLCRKQPNDAEPLLDLAQTYIQQNKQADAERTFRSIAGLPDKKYRTAHAVYLYQVGRHEEGIRELVQLAAADPSSREVRTLLVSAYLAQGQAGVAQDILDQALARNAKDLHARVQRARLHLSSRRYAEAQTDLAQVLGFEPGSAEAHYLLAKVHSGRGDFRMERQELAAALRFDKNMIAARVDLSRSLISIGDSQAALRLLQETPPAQAQLMPIQMQTNWALLAVKDRDRARRAIEAGLASRRSSELLLQAALLKLDQKDANSALVLLNEALGMAPADPRILQTIATTYVMRREPDKALSFLRQHASGHPDAVPVQAVTGRWLLDAGELAGAREAYARVSSLAPNALAPLLALARIDLAEGKVEAARDRLSRSANSSQISPEVCFLLGNLELEANNRQEAVRWYRKTIELDSRHQHALNNLAYLLAEDAGQREEALRLAQQAMEASPNDAAIADTLGWIYYRKGMYQAAVKHLEAAVASGEPVTRYHLGFAYARAGREKDAQRTLQAALRAAPDLPEAALARRTLTAGTTLVR